MTANPELPDEIYRAAKEFACSEYVGLARVRCAGSVDRAITFLYQNGYINTRTEAPATRTKLVETIAKAQETAATLGLSIIQTKALIGECVMSLANEAPATQAEVDENLLKRLDELGLPRSVAKLCSNDHDMIVAFAETLQSPALQSKAPTATGALTERIEGLRKTFSKEEFYSGEKIVTHDEIAAWNAALDAVLELSKGGAE